LMAILDSYFRREKSEWFISQSIVNNGKGTFSKSFNPSWKNAL
jgi:hypothetical protein